MIKQGKSNPKAGLSYESIYNNLISEVVKRKISNTLFLPSEVEDVFAFLKVLKRRCKGYKVVSSSEINKDNFSKLVNANKIIFLLANYLTEEIKEFIIARLMMSDKKKTHIVILDPILLINELEFLNGIANLTFTINQDLLEEADFENSNINIDIDIEIESRENKFQTIK